MTTAAGSKGVLRLPEGERAPAARPARRISRHQHRAGAQAGTEDARADCDGRGPDGGAARGTRAGHEPGRAAGRGSSKAGRSRGSDLGVLITSATTSTSSVGPRGSSPTSLAPTSLPFTIALPKDLSRRPLTACWRCSRPCSTRPAKSAGRSPTRAKALRSSRSNRASGSCPRMS